MFLLPLGLSWVVTGREGTWRISYNVAGPYLFGAGSSAKRWTKCSSSSNEVVGTQRAQDFLQHSDPLKLENSSVPSYIPDALLPILIYSKEKSLWHHPFPTHWMDSRREHQNDDMGEAGFQQLTLQTHLSPTADHFPIYPHSSPLNHRLLRSHVSQRHTFPGGSALPGSQVHKAYCSS